MTHDHGDVMKLPAGLVADYTLGGLLLGGVNISGRCLQDDLVMMSTNC